MRFYLDKKKIGNRTFKDVAQERKMHQNILNQKTGWSLKMVINYDLWEFVDTNKIDKNTIKVYEQLKQLIEEKEDN